MTSRAFIAVLALTALRLGAAEESGGLAPFVPPINSSNVFRLWGSAPLAGVAKNWIEGFRALHPEIKIETRLDGTGLAMPGLYTGAADLALFGREPNRTDRDGFEHVLGYKHLQLEIAAGSVSHAGHTTALGVFVHRDNPLARLTLAQLDALFGHERRRGAPRQLRTWGDLGLTGEWAARPIHLFAPDTRSGPRIFFQLTVLRDSSKWNWERLTEFADTKNSAGTVRHAAAQILAALAADRDGLAVATLGLPNPQVKPLALATDAPDRDTDFVSPTRETVASRAYPLARPIYLCVNRRPGAPLDAKTKAFLDYVLSPAGQQAVAATEVYLPLAPDAARRQRALLD
jgi:phosphate transport system substrate-binding protein